MMTDSQSYFLSRLQMLVRLQELIKMDLTNMEIPFSNRLVLFPSCDSDCGWWCFLAFFLSFLPLERLLAGCWVLASSQIFGANHFSISLLLSRSLSYFPSYAHCRKCRGGPGWCIQMEMNWRVGRGGFELVCVCMCGRGPLALLESPQIRLSSAELQWKAVWEKRQREKGRERL